MQTCFIFNELWHWTKNRKQKETLQWACYLLGLVSLKEKKVHSSNGTELCVSKQARLFRIARRKINKYKCWQKQNLPCRDSAFCNVAGRDSYRIAKRKPFCLAFAYSCRLKWRRQYFCKSAKCAWKNRDVSQNSQNRGNLFMRGWGR